MVNFFFGASVNGQWLDPSPQPFLYFIVPVSDQAGGRHHHSFLNFRLAVWTLPEKRPHESDALQGFAQPHLICHDTAMTPGDPPARHTLPEEFHSLPWNCSVRAGWGQPQNDNFITALLLHCTRLILQQTTYPCSTSQGMYSTLMREGNHPRHS